MSAHTPPRFEIDERFLHEWVEMGIADMAAYLAKHAGSRPSASSATAVRPRAAEIEI